MQIIFTRTGEKTYSTLAMRDDGVTVHVPGFDRTGWMPHDLAHYVVEYELGLQSGFWGCVAAGMLCSGMQVVDGRQRPHAKERSKTVLREAGQLTSEAEGLVAAIVEIARQGWHYQPGKLPTVLNNGGQSYYSSRQSLQSEQVRQVCSKLCQYRQEWLALAIGQSLEVKWLRPKNTKTGKRTE